MLCRPAHPSCPAPLGVGGGRRAALCLGRCCAVLRMQVGGGGWDKQAAEDACRQRDVEKEKARSRNWGTFQIG